MAITYIGTNGLFTRLGLIFGLAEDVDADMDAIVTTVGTIGSAFTGSTAFWLGGLADATAVANASGANSMTLIQQAAQTVLMEQIYAQSTTQLRRGDLRAALKQLIKEMVADGYYVETQGYTGAGASYGTSTGTGKIVLSFQRPQFLDGMDSGESANYSGTFSETIELICTHDARTGGTRSGSERFSARGERAFGPNDYRWPGGSGFSNTVVSTSSDVDALSGGNQLTNSSFEVVESNLPLNWDIVTGTAGTHIIGGSSTGTRGSYGLKFAGSGGTTARIRQTFGASTGTQAYLQPDTVYTLSIDAKSTSAPPGTTLTIQLEDSTGSTLSDGTDAATQLSLNVTSASATTSYQRFSTSWKTPANLPTTSYISISGGALGAGEDWTFDNLILAPAQRLYPGGPAVTINAAATDWAVGDRITYGITNARGAKWFFWFNRFLRLQEYGLSLPTSGAPGATTEVSEALIT